ncbi:MAG TPA: L-aspartate oxidase [Methylovirgula sp.]
MTMDIRNIDSRPLIIGGGLAGLMTALQLAPQPVVLLSKSRLGGETSSILAQGGIAAAVGPDDDPDLHIADTLAAGDGLCDVAAVERIIRSGPAAIEDLARFGVHFDRDGNGALLLGLEAAHSRHRIIHAGGDASGREIIRALVEAVRKTPSITLIGGLAARRLIVEDGRVRGVLATGPLGPVLLPTNRVVIATGGIGGLFLHGTNPAGSFGQGLALAARAGAELADLEFVQFHPTALDSAGFPLKLISEAVRGEGAVLIDETGQRFMAKVAGAELAPRDVVARAIWHHMLDGHHIYLDARNLKGVDFHHRFPAITALCADAGIDPLREPIPIRPAAHYHMGGIKVDLDGRSSIEGLWACGEAACTGLHGANRLASNSLLEAAVCGKFVAEGIKGTSAANRFVAAGESLPPIRSDPNPVRPILSRAAGVLRDRASLQEAAAALYPLVTANAPASDAALVGLMIVTAALRREESRGAHARSDFPKHDDSRVWRRTIDMAGSLDTARALVPDLVA